MRSTATPIHEDQVTFCSRLYGDLERSRPSLRGTPILLLHGFLATSRSMTALERRLERDGFRVFSLTLGGRFNTRSIEAQAVVVRDEVERMYATEPELPALTVIGHSLGGLVAAWWVKRLGGHRRVRTVVTLGTPHAGTRTAWAGILLAWLLPALVQMLPGSGFLRRLGETRWPARVALVSLYSRRDRVAPWPGSLVDAQLANARNVEVDGGHSDYLLKKGIYHVVRNELRRAAAREARPAVAAAAAAAASESIAA
ncbi:MAG: esterase/lipase family protein [Anaeromyxobacteraceae bacterium]